MPFRHVQSVLAAFVFHQVFDLTCAPHSEQTNLAVTAFDSAQAPEGIIEAVTVENLYDRHRLVIGLGLVQRTKQLRPAFVARRVFADLVQGGAHVLSKVRAARLLPAGSVAMELLLGMP
jgi:hypothetical protein